MNNKGLPNNIDAEKGIIGSMFWSYSSLQKGCEEVYKEAFYLDKNAKIFEVIKDLYDNNVSYIIFREYGIDNFLEIIEDTKKYLLSSCTLDSYVSKYKGIGNTGFFFKKTIYKVK